MLPCSQRALVLVLEHVGNFGVLEHVGNFGLVAAAMASVYSARSNVKPLCHRMTGVSKMFLGSMICS